MTDLALSKESFLNIIDVNATLATATRIAKTLTAAQKGNAIFADFYLTLQYDGGPPTAGATIAELYLVPGDGETSEHFAQGGDGTVGADVDPQKALLVGTFETRSPSVTVDEVLVVRSVELGIGTDRIVLKNVSGQTFDSTWQLDAVLKTYKTA
jgi:hypothetical protein